MPRRKFTSAKTANAFAKAVGGKMYDLRKDPNAKCNFIVKYESTEKTKKHYELDFPDFSEWCPEEGHDFGYPNEFWE